VPIFECSRCNDLTYSSARENAAPCPACGAARKRLVHDAASFAEAKQVPRATSRGDHSIAVFDDFAQVVGVASQFVDEAVVAGGFVVAAVPQELEGLIRTRLRADPDAIAWEPPGDTYGRSFEPHPVIEHFRGIAAAEDRPLFVLGCPDEPIQGFTSHAGWLEYERLAQETAVEDGITVLCMYDTRLHDEAMLRVGLVTHGLTVKGDRFCRNAAFEYQPPAAG
jgi:hypothetical protein